MISNVAYHYGWSDAELMDTPWSRFMLYNHNLPRILAENQLRVLMSAAASQSDKGFKSLNDDLSDTIAGRRSGKRHRIVGEEPPEEMKRDAQEYLRQLNADNPNANVPTEVFNAEAYVASLNSNPYTRGWAEIVEPGSLRKKLAEKEAKQKAAEESLHAKRRN